MAVQTYVVDFGGGRFSGRPIRKYPTPYLGLIFRLIITACLCYSVQLITKDEIPQHLYAVKAALCVYFVLENIYVYVHMLLFKAPQRHKELMKQCWCTRVFFIVRAFVIIASAVTFWQMTVKFASIRSYVTVIVICLIADISMMLARSLHHAKELKMMNWYLNLYDDRNQLAGVEFMTPDSENKMKSIIDQQGSNRIGIVFVFAVFVFCVYDPEVKYHLCARLIFTALGILDTTYFLYSVETAKPTNERELSMHEEKMNNLRLNKWYAVFTPMLYFDLVMKISIGTDTGLLLSMLHMYYLLDDRLLCLQIKDYKRRLGIPIL